MKKLQTEIIIDASAAEVWEVLLAFDQYPTWNPFIKAIEGEPKVGSRLKNTMQLKEGTQQVFKPKVLKVIPEKEFRWLGSLFFKGLFDGEHFFQLEAIGSNQTKLIHGEYFSGILSGIILAKIGAATQQNFENMNLALKERVHANIVQ